jgi:hypothetical protein
MLAMAGVFALCLAPVAPTLHAAGQANDGRLAPPRNVAQIYLLNLTEGPAEIHDFVVDREHLTPEEALGPGDGAALRWIEPSWALDEPRRTRKVAEVWVILKSSRLRAQMRLKSGQGYCALLVTDKNHHPRLVTLPAGRARSDALMARRCRSLAKRFQR